MLFCSYIFVLLFLPVTVAGYFSLNKFNRTAGKIWLLAASLFFYGYFNLSYLLLLIVSLIFNYLIGLLLDSHKRRWLLALGVIVNLLLLGYCKYYDFFPSKRAFLQFCHSSCCIFCIFRPSSHSKLDFPRKKEESPSLGKGFLRVYSS